MNLKFSSMIQSGLIILLVVGLLVSNGCKKESSVSTNQVTMQNIAFNPNSITVSKNTTVTWTNNDNMTHNVTSNSGLFSSGNIAPGGTYSFQFTATGTYPYHCTIHAGMNGTVIVQ
jgi:plastocyanin